MNEKSFTYVHENQEQAAISKSAPTYVFGLRVGRHFTSMLVEIFLVVHRGSAGCSDFISSQRSIRAEDYELAAQDYRDRFLLYKPELG